MPDNPRIEELRRRVQKDPASIAFAQLAEEFRRSGNYDEAVRVCRTGLAKHPSYLSARVTLGRALIELEQYDEAQTELDYVLRSAPENLAAIRGLAEIHQRRGNLGEALKQYQMALGIAKHDPELEESVHELSRQLGPTHAAVAPPPARAEAPPPLPPVRTDARTYDSPPPIPIDVQMSGTELPAVDDPMPALETFGTASAPDVPLQTRAEEPQRDTPLSPELEAAADEFSRALEALDAITIDLPAPALVESFDLPKSKPAEDERVVPADKWEVEGFDAAWMKRNDAPSAADALMHEPAPPPTSEPEAPPVNAADMDALGELEQWLDTIVTDRGARAK